MFPAMTSQRGTAADIGEIIVDEMLAICSNIDRWRGKKVWLRRYIIVRGVIRHFQVKVNQMIFAPLVIRHY